MGRGEGLLLRRADQLVTHEYHMRVVRALVAERKELEAALQAALLVEEGDDGLLNR